MVELQNSIVKTHLIQQIENLKNDIQLLIDYKKTLQNPDEIRRCNDNKQKSIIQLKYLNQKLKDIHQEEKLNIKKQNDLKSVSRAIDNMEYQIAKKKNNQSAVENIKLKRDETRQQYLDYQIIEQKYSKYDSKLLPRILFLHPEILKTYGLFPHIQLDNSILNNDTTQRTNLNTGVLNFHEIENSDETETFIINEQLFKTRLQWLQSQSDGGNLYMKLYDELINQSELNLLSQNLQELDHNIYTFFKTILSPSQLELYDNSYSFIQEYVNCRIKTKRIKESYKSFINNLSILYSETSIEFHTYFSLLFNTAISINIINPKTQSDFIEDKFSKIVLNDQFTSYIEQYKLNIENKNLKLKYITNTIRNLNEALHLFLMDRQKFLSKQDITFLKHQKFTQTGKYFKKWSLLTPEERLERFLTFSNYYVNKNLIEKMIITNDDKDLFVDKLYNLLKDAFLSKQILYKDISWNIKHGIIETIKNLTFTNENIHNTNSNPFKLCLKITNTSQNNLTETQNVTEMSNDTNNVSLNKPKKTSTKTIITKESDKIINEELLHYILKQIQNGVSEPLNDDKNTFLERIKLKLKVKRLTINDKTKIYEKYDEIFKVIFNNRQI